MLDDLEARYMIVVAEGKNFRLVGAARFKNKLLLLPGRKGWKNDQFFCERSRANVEFIAAEFPLAEWKCDDREQLNRLREQESSIIGSETGDIGDYDFKTTPFNHQMVAFMRSRDLPWYAYLMEMGTGKTKVLIDNIAYLWHNSKIDGAIVVAPNGVHRQFVREQIPIHMPDDVSLHMDCFVYQSGGDKAFMKRRAAFLKPNRNKLRILAINVESLSVKSGVDYVVAFLRSIGGVGSIRPVLMAVDESTRIKNHGSKRSKNIQKLGSYCAYRRILTGSPVTKGIEDLFGQLAFLSEKILGFTSFYTFRNHFCITKSNTTAGGKKSYSSIEGYQNVDELKEKLKKWSYRVKKEDCLDLPPKIYTTRQVELSKQQRDMYNQLRSEFFIELDGLEMNATMAAVRLTKLQQILCGHIRFTEQGKLVEIEDVPRLDAVREIIEECEGQVIIWARFRPDIDRLCKLLHSYGVSRYDGAVDNSGKERSKSDFMSGKNRIFVGQPASAGLGLNLVGPETVIYYSNSFDAEHRWQSEDRNHRSGAEGKHVTYIDLEVPGSVDAYIRQVLLKKKDVASMTIDDYRTILQQEL